MAPKTIRPTSIVLGILLVAVATATVILLLPSEPEPNVYRMAVCLPGAALQGADQEYWVGDVSELYRLGRIPKGLAEADTAPLKPLTPTPKPFHGYFVRAMESAPFPSYKEGSPETISLKGKTTIKGTCAFCIYPASGENPNRYVWIVCPWAVFRKANAGNKPLVEWPTGEWRRDWAIVD